MKDSVVKIFEESDRKAKEDFQKDSFRSSNSYSKALSFILEKNSTAKMSDIEYERSIVSYIFQKKKKMVMRVLHTTLVDISCSISSVLTLLSLLLISFNTTGLINLFYVVFCLVFLYQMKSFIFQKRWTFPIYLEKLLKPFVFIEI